MPTVRRIFAIVLLTATFSTFALGDDGWIGTGNKPPQPAEPTKVSYEIPAPTVWETGEESSYFDELYEATLLFLQMGLL
jgi:cell division protein FtsW (lipid II flippase)